MINDHDHSIDEIILGRTSLEIGSSYGHFIVEYASSQVETLCIGVEVNEKRYLDSVERLERSGLKNVKIFNDDASNFVLEQCSEQKFDEVHIYFPTPYINSTNEDVDVKKKLNGRLLSYFFLKRIFFILKVGGSLRVVIDHLEYFDEITAILSKFEFIPLPWVRPISSVDINNYVGTHWELKQKKEGKKIYAIQCTKLG